MIMAGRTHELLASEIKERAAELKAGDRVILSGTIYTSRDAAHKRLFEISLTIKQTNYHKTKVCRSLEPTKVAV